MLTKLSLGLEDAHVLIEAATAAARGIGVPMCIAVVDESGTLIAFERMNGGKVTSVTIAIDKAYTAAAARKATHEYGTASQPGSPAYGINSAIGGRLMIVAGGLPVEVDGQVVGGIGLSSGTPQQDRDVAQAAVAHFLAHRGTGA